MWERENLQIWAPSQNLQAAKCHGRADVKQVNKNRCVNDRKGGRGSFLQLSLLYSVRLDLGILNHVCDHKDEIQTAAHIYVTLKCQRRLLSHHPIMQSRDPAAVTCLISLKHISPFLFVNSVA